MEKRQKELLEHIKHWIKSCSRNGCDASCSIKEQVDCTKAENALRRLVEKFCGKGGWQKRAHRIMGYGKDVEQRLLQLEEFARDIRDFNPMAAEPKEKIKVGVR